LKTIATDCADFGLIRKKSMAENHECRGPNPAKLSEPGNDLALRPMTNSQIVANPSPALQILP